MGVYLINVTHKSLVNNSELSTMVTILTLKKPKQQIRFLKWLTDELCCKLKLWSHMGLLVTVWHVNVMSPSVYATQ